MSDADKEWWDNFRGRCVSCWSALPSTRKNEMRCENQKAWTRGLPSRGGGTKFYEPVHKMFGCVYYVSAKKKAG